MASAVAAASRLKALQSQPANKTCADCDQKCPRWASVSFGIFMCLECAGKHRGLGVHISFVRSVSMDSWSETQLKKMEASGGNAALNSFLLKHGIPKETDIESKYKSKAAEAYREKVQFLAEGKEWKEPEVLVVVKERSSSGRDGDERRIAKKTGFGSHGVGSSSRTDDGYGYSDWGARDGGRRGSREGARHVAMGDAQWKSEGACLDSHSHGAGFDEAPVAEPMVDFKNLMQVSWRFVHKFLRA